MTDKIPKGFKTVTPSFVFHDCAKALAFYEKAFGATARKAVKGPDGRIVHSELVIGDSVVFASDPMPGSPVQPVGASGPAVGMYLYVPDCDAFIDKAVAAGASLFMPCADMFYGDRVGAIKD